MKATRSAPLHAPSASTRAFTRDDQDAFARLSGDWNPLHVDPVVARRFLFGEPVVHGVHSLLWALDHWLRNHTAPVKLRVLKAVFRRPIGVGERVRHEVVADEGGRVEIELSVGDAVATLVRFEWVPGSDCRGPRPDPRSPEVGTARELSADQLEGRSARLPLALDVEEIVRLLPCAVDRLPHLQIAALLTTTQLVGMECPGLHSIFSELNLAFDEPGDGPPELSYRVQRYLPRYRLALLQVESPGARGTIKAFLRPEPVRQASYATLRAQVARDEFAGQQALVIGGSRGLGEVAAKLLAAGGADVRLTYHRGAEDAERVAAEIGTGDGSARALAYDVMDPESSPVCDPAGWVPTHLYYFATPRIAASGALFSPAAFRTFCDFYVNGFIRCVEPLASAGLRAVLYPSTVFVDEPVAGMAEYGAAKAAGEAVCRHLAREYGIAIHAPRLPRLATDQAASLLTHRTDDPAPVMLEHLRRLREADATDQV